MISSEESVEIMRKAYDLGSQTISVDRLMQLS